MERDKIISNLQELIDAGHEMLKRPHPTTPFDAATEERIVALEEAIKCVKCVYGSDSIEPLTYEQLLTMGGRPVRFKRVHLGEHVEGVGLLWTDLWNNVGVMCLDSKLSFYVYCEGRYNDQAKGVIYPYSGADFYSVYNPRLSTERLKTMAGKAVFAVRGGGHDAVGQWMLVNELNDDYNHLSIIAHNDLYHVALCYVEDGTWSLYEHEVKLEV